MSDYVRDRSGEMVPVRDDTDCHWLCNGVTGETRDPDPADRVLVACPVHRPHLVEQRERALALR